MWVEFGLKLADGHLTFEGDLVEYRLVVETFTGIIGSIVSMVYLTFGLAFFF